MNSTQLALSGQQHLEQLQATAERAETYATQYQAPNTTRGYKSDWGQFTAWCAERQVDPMPAAPEAVALYITDMADRGLKAATIARHLTTIRQAHRGAGHPTPTTHRSVEMVRLSDLVEREGFESVLDFTVACYNHWISTHDIKCALFLRPKEWRRMKRDLDRERLTQAASAAAEFTQAAEEVAKRFTSGMGVKPGLKHRMKRPKMD